MSPAAERDRTWLSIQHLRGFAALSVVLFHACQWSQIDFATGQAGVDVFFVISGFVMWTATTGEPVRPFEFLKRRVIRVVPLYWLITVVLAAGVLLFPARFPDLAVTPGHLALSLAFVQHMNPAGYPFPLLAPGWTLNYEAVFYLAFAGLLWLPEARRLVALTFTLMVLAFAGFAWPPAYQMLLNPLFLEFLGGVWLARMAQTGRRRLEADTGPPGARRRVLFDLPDPPADHRRPGHDDRRLESVDLHSVGDHRRGDLRPGLLASGRATDAEPAATAACLTQRPVRILCITPRVRRGRYRELGNEADRRTGGDAGGHGLAGRLRQEDGGYRWSPHCGR